MITKIYGMTYFFPSWNNPTITTDVKIQPIISNDTNQSGPLRITGKRVSGDNHVVKVNPAIIAVIFNADHPFMNMVAMMEKMRTR